MATGSVGAPSVALPPDAYLGSEEHLQDLFFGEGVALVGGRQPSPRLGHHVRGGLPSVRPVGVPHPGLRDLLLDGQLTAPLEVGHQRLHAVRAELSPHRGLAGGVLVDPDPEESSGPLLG